MFAPLRILGDAVKDKLALLSASTRASSLRSGYDDESLYGDPARDTEEARGLLQSGYHSGEEEDEIFSPPKEACGWAAAFALPERRPSQPKPARGEDDDNEGQEFGSEEDAINALMKLRPSARDSLGDDETDCEEGSTRPLVGTERANLLSR